MVSDIRIIRRLVMGSRPLFTRYLRLKEQVPH